MYNVNNTIQKTIQLVTLAIILSSLEACMVLPMEESDKSPSLYWCPPLPNCASTEAISFIHNIQAFELKIPLTDAWPIIRKAVNDLPGTEIHTEFSGYIFAKSYTPVFNFLDYLEVLAIPDENRLNVRSSSLLGLSDLGVNYFRTERLREILEDKGVIELKP